MAKYDPLYEWLLSKVNAGKAVVLTTFSEIDEILGVPLPKSARTYKRYRSWWANDETRVQAAGGWMAAEWKVDHIDLASEQVTFKRRFNEPVSISEAIRQLNRKSVIICPDTCALLNFVKLEKRSANNSPWIDRFDDWERQLDKCESLLFNEAVGWVIPEQIKREFEDNSDKEFQPFGSAEKEIISGSNLSGSNLNGYIATLNSELQNVLNGFKARAKNCQNKIIRKAVLLKEERHSLIRDAWSLVRSDEFPNNKGDQQMKDSVILSYLYEIYRFGGKSPISSDHSPEQAEFLTRLFQNHLGINSNIYFWTFDSFYGQMKDGSMQFPQKSAQRYIEIKNNISLIHSPAPNSISSQIIK